MTRAFVASDSRGQWLVVTEAATREGAQASGAWLKTRAPAEVER